MTEKKVFTEPDQSVCVFSGWDPEKRNSVCELWHRNDYTVEEKRCGRASLQRLWALLQTTPGIANSTTDYIMYYHSYCYYSTRVL